MSALLFIVFVISAASVDSCFKAGFVCMCAVAALLYISKREELQKKGEEMATKKYEFTGETKKADGFANVTVRRIRAIVEFGTIKAGDLGGWIEKEGNLSEEGDAWIYDNATVCGNATVCNDAGVYDDARVYGNALICGNALVYDDTEVYGNAMVYSNARICGNAKVSGDAEVYGNALVCGHARVCDNAKVCGHARVCGNAKVSGGAEVFGNAKVCGNAEVLRASHFLVIGPIGSRDDFTTFFRDKDNEVVVKCGCFLGKLNIFLAKVQNRHGNSKHALVYRAAAEVARMQIDLTQEGEKQMGYKTCPYCGANLDPDEQCDCRDEASASQQEDEAGHSTLMEPDKHIVHNKKEDNY